LMLSPKSSWFIAFPTYGISSLYPIQFSRLSFTTPHGKILHVFGGSL